MQRFQQTVLAALSGAFPAMTWRSEHRPSAAQDAIDIFGDSDISNVVIELDKSRADQVSKKFVSRSALFADEDFCAVRLDFLGPSGEPIPVTINGQTASTFTLGIDLGGITRIKTDGVGAGTRAGHIRVTALAHSTPFEAFAILNFKQSGITVTTTSLPMVQPGSVVRLHVDESGAQLQTGLRSGLPARPPV